MTTTKQLTEPSGFSDSDEETHVTQRIRRRGNIRACDVCRRKKIRCDLDVSRDPSKPCINCTVFKTECTFAYVPKKRKPQQGYVESLQRRIDNLERLVTALAPNVDLKQDIDHNAILAACQLQSALPISSPSPPARTEEKRLPLSQWHASLDEDDTSDEDVAYVFQGPQGIKAGTSSYFGTSSGLNLLNRLVDMKLQDNNDRPVKLSLASNIHQQSELRHFIGGPFTFPTFPLMFSLFEHYFRLVNIFFPIIHRPSFEDDVRNHRHISDPAFGAVVLSVCAIGSRWSDDQEVFSKAYGPATQNLADDVDQASAGWHYYLQVYMYRKDCLEQTSLCDLQRMALGSIYMQSSKNASISWQLSGLGVRLAVELGAHRKMAVVSPPDSEAQKAMWKRVFWSLIVLDRINSAILGRPCAIWDEDIDVDLPCIVDDEYLTPEANFTQPIDKPSRMSYLISMIKLTEILAYALKTLYAIRKSRTVYPVMGPTWEQEIVVGLDSTLNGWIDSIPEHLRWDPYRQTDEITFCQSAGLHIAYHYVQILVHRRYIVPRPKKGGSTPSVTLPSLAICTNAARSCSHIFRALLERKTLMTPELTYFAYTMAAILLYNLWGSNRSKPVKETDIKDWEHKMEDVKTCLAFIDLSIDRCHRGRKLSLLLHNLTSDQLRDHFESSPTLSQDENNQQDDFSLFASAQFNSNGSASSSVSGRPATPMESLQGESLDSQSCTMGAPNEQAYYDKSSVASAQHGLPSWYPGRWPAEPHDLFSVLDPMYFPVDATPRGDITTNSDVFQSQNWIGATGDMGWLPSSLGFQPPPTHQPTTTNTNPNMVDPNSGSARGELGTNCNIDWFAQFT